jgi:methyl-accepting chemotaxis protein
MTSLHSFQKIVAQALMTLSLAHVPVLGLLAWVLNQPAIPAALIAMVLAAAPVAAWMLRRPMKTVAFALAIALVGQTSLLVYVFSGHPWQVEMHFYYFAVLALLSGFCEWPVLLTAALLIAGHHLSLDFMLPAAVYPGGSNFLRVAVHAVVVVIETAMLIGIGLAIRTAFAQADAMRREAEESSVQNKRITAVREQELLASTKRVDRMDKLLDRFQKEMMDSTGILHEAAREFQADADSLARAASHSNVQSAAAAVASEDTASKVRSAAAAGEELAQTISEVGLNAAQSSRLANDAVDKAATTTATMDELAAAVHEINKVTELINAIASQTNLLALNATIEAARAGEAGRGFAVVAHEVKALAAQTASATQDIGRRIESMRTVTGRSVEAIAAITGAIRELDLFSARIAAAVEQQAGAAHEIAGSAHAAASGVNQVNDAIVQIEKVADHAAQSAGKLGAAAKNVANQTKMIRDRVTKLTESIHAIQA